MTDWFETRFRGDVDAPLVEPVYAARVRALVVEEWHANSPAAVSLQGDAAAGESVRDPGVTPDDPEGETIVLEIHDKSREDETVSVVREPRRRWLVVAAAASVVIVAGVALARGGDDDDPIDAATPATPSSETTSTDPATPQDVLELWEDDFVPLDPGLYSVDPDGDDATPLRVTFEIEGFGWESWIGAVKFSESSHSIVTITTIDNVVREGCVDHSLVDPPIGPSVDDLSTALSNLAPFEVTKPASDVTVLGYPGQHLQWTVPDLAVIGTGADRNFADCHSDVLHSWTAPNLDGSFYGYNGEPGRTEDFWILDVEGTRLVIITTASSAAPAEDLREMDAIFDSIQIEP